MAKRLGAVAVICITTWVLLEIAANVLVLLHIKPDINLAIGATPYPDGNYVAGEVDFDPVNGYRVTECPWRYLRVTEGTLIFDTESCMNSAGFREDDELDADVRPGTRRVMVLGDSFTHMWYADVAWPDVLEGELADSRVYNLALAGTGIENWYSIYRGHLEQRAYDVLVLAIFAVDMKRDFTVADVRGDQLLFGHFDTPPPDREAYEAQFDATMNPSGTRISYAEADRVAGAFTGTPRLGPGFYFSRIVRAVADGRLSWRARGGSGGGGGDDDEDPFPGNDDPVAALAAYSDSLHASHLEEIVAGARAAGVRVVLASVPGRGQLLRYLRGDPDPFDALLQRLAVAWDVEYFSGYEPFDGVSRRDVRTRYWLTYDGHWSEAGAARFARALAVRLEQPRDRSGSAGR